MNAAPARQASSPPPDAIPISVFRKSPCHPVEIEKNPNEESGTMIHKHHPVIASILIIWSLSWAAASAQEPAELVLQGDTCIRAEGFGKLQRATLALWLQIHKLPGDYNSILHSDDWEQGDWHLLLRPDGQLQNSIKGNNPANASLDVWLKPDRKKWRHLAVV